MTILAIIVDALLVLLAVMLLVNFTNRGWPL